MMQCILLKLQQWETKQNLNSLVPVQPKPTIIKSTYTTAN